MSKNRIPRGYHSFIRMLGVICLAVAASSLTGCITYLTEIRLRADGSGTMVQTMTMNPTAMKEMMEGIAKAMGATMSESKTDAAPDAQKESSKPAPKASEQGPFKEGDLKGKAADMGQGVTFVSAEKIETKTAVGVRVTYAFKDINQLSMNPKPGAALGTDAPGASSKDALKFRLKRLPGGNSTLTVILPPPEPKAPKEQAAEEPPASPSPESSPEQVAMAKQMFKGLHMGIVVDVEGKVVRTNSPYVEGSKVTLMDIDFDPLLSDEEGFRKLNEKMDAAKGDDLKTMEALKTIKGLKITTAPEISIEFAPQ